MSCHTLTRASMLRQGSHFLSKPAVLSFSIRRLSHGARLSQAAAPVFCSGAEDSQLGTGLTSLLVPRGRWTLSSNGHGVERSFRFKTFKAAWNFMNSVADQCKLARHHPEWANVYNSVFVRWTTHSPPGLSEHDLELAGLCDRLASKSETVDGSQSTDDSKLKDLTREAGTNSQESSSEPEKEKQRQMAKEKVEEEERDPKGAQGSLAGIGGQPT